MNEPTVLSQAKDILESRPDLLLPEGARSLPAAERFLERQRFGLMQQKLIAEWADEECLWLNSYTDDSGREYGSLEAMLEAEYIPSLFSGSEANVYMDKGGDWLIKAISLLHEDDNPQMMFERIALYNNYFPATALEVLGFGRDNLGQFRTIVKQRFLSGKDPSEDEIIEYAKGLGFTKEGGWWHSPGNIFRMTDLTPLNLIKVGDGQLYPIDVDMELLSGNYLEEQLTEEYRFNKEYVKGHIQAQPHLSPTQMEDQMRAIHEHVYHGGNMYRWERL